jgi:C4-dicarboxylate-specific signal transduction histidine kinase
MAESNTPTLTQQLNATAMERVEAAVVAIDATGAVILLNRGASRLLNVPPGSHIGQPAENILGTMPPEDPDPNEEFVYRIETADGEQRWIRACWAWTTVTNPNQRIRLLIATDHTRAHNLQKNLVRSAALAELGLMAAEVAHEVNNPATYLMTNLSILRDDLATEVVDTAGASELVEECLDGVNRITDVVKRMRSLASSSGEEIGSELIDLSTIVRDACRIAGLRVKYRADLHIHDESTVLVQGSSKRLGQVVLNLVVNAADALTGQAEPMPRIDVSVSEENGFGVVSVRDNGPGIPEAKRESIFQAFITSKSSTGGTGLGLAVSQTIAEEHGGSLRLERHDSMGAWFKLRLPLP